MTASYTFDIFSSLDGFGSYDVDTADWGGYWGKGGPELEARRLALLSEDQRMVFGATTFRDFVGMLGSDETNETGVHDTWVTRMRRQPTTIVSSTLHGPLDWPDATIASGDALDIVRQLKASSKVPLRSHGSLQLNMALLVAGLVDRIQVTVFPVVCGVTGRDPIFAGAPDLDLELLEHRTLDGSTQELIYRPTLRH